MEQSLKAVVNLHRSLIAASVVALVLGLTTGGAGPEEVLRVRAEELLAVDFEEYEAFVSRQAAGHISMLPGQADIFEAALADRGVRLSTAGSFLISDLFDPVGISTAVRIQNSNFKEQGVVSLTDLSELASAFEASGDAKLLAPDPVSLAEEIQQVMTLGRDGDDLREVTGVRRASPPPVLQMPFVDDGTEAAYSVSYREHVGGPEATQQITLSAETKAHPVPGTSLVDWLRQQPRLGDDLFSASADAVTLLPSNDLSVLSRSVPLSQLPALLDEKAAARRSRLSSVKVLGIDLPGSLLFTAFPIVVGVLGYYVVQHLAHVRSLVAAGKDRGPIDACGWLPVVMRTRLPLDRSGRRSVEFWRLEAVAGLVLLPAAALGAMLVNAILQSDNGWTVGVLVAGIICAIVNGVLAVRSVAELRADRPPKGVITVSS